MFLPALRAVGDDGNLVTARHIAAHSGVSLDLIERMHRAIGLVRVDADLSSRARMRNPSSGRLASSTRAWVRSRSC